MARVAAIIRVPINRSRVCSRHRWTRPSSLAIATSSTRHSAPKTWRQRLSSPGRRLPWLKLRHGQRSAGEREVTGQLTGLRDDPDGGDQRIRAPVIVPPTRCSSRSPLGDGWFSETVGSDRVAALTW